ncbi:MAG: GTP 3',8-cyclase MoaA [Pirellulales bacterium]|nr:GTP 3',8-cyclase MoaA [Pirellulales bacterium]
MPENASELIDSFGRRHTNLRVAVTDRCNIRCFYCMPAENVLFKARDELLTFEEITRFVRVAVKLGVNKIRLTGGEPLVRQNVPELVRQLRAIDGIEDIALTTNGMLLADHAQALYDAGLHRLNISLDALSKETFERITRRQGLDQVLEGIFTAQRVGFSNIKLNAVAMAGITEDEVLPFGHFARQHDLEVRFIEFMPLDADDAWQRDRVLPGEQIRSLLEEGIAPLTPAPRLDPSQPATDYVFADGRGKIGFINPVTQPFCQDCNRLRLTAEGQVRNCLFSTEEWDARAIIRGGGTDQQLAQLMQESITAKKAGHGIDSDEFIKPQRAMYQIGG